MFVLRRRHLKAIESAPDGEFVHRLAEHVRRLFPLQAATLAPDELFRRVAAAREKAREYGLTTERNIALFVDLGIGLGPDFEARPECDWVVRILRDPGHSEYAKIYLIYRDLPDRAPASG
jgi:hypothetical protein